MNKKEQERGEKLEQIIGSDEYFLMSYSKSRHGYEIEIKSPSDVRLIEMFMAMLDTKDIQPYLAMALEQVSANWKINLLNGKRNN